MTRPPLQFHKPVLLVAVKYMLSEEASRSMMFHLTNSLNLQLFVLPRDKLVRGGRMMTELIRGCTYLISLKEKGDSRMLEGCIFLYI